MQSMGDVFVWDHDDPRPCDVMHACWPLATLAFDLSDLLFNTDHDDLDDLRPLAIINDDVIHSMPH